MIHPSQLTREAGFEEGVVVEIALEDGHCKIVYWRAKTEWRWEKIRNIRPLTGDMAIWNFAPEWAEWLVNWGDSIQWGVNEDNAGSGIMIKRPWWAK